MAQTYELEAIITKTPYIIDSMRLLVFSFLLVFSLMASITIAAPAPPTLRLGNQAHPERYAVQLTLDPDREAFEGQIEIALTLQEPTSLIWLNGTNLEGREASIASNGTSQK